MVSHLSQREQPGCGVRSLLELDVALCQLLLSLTPHGKWQWEVKGLILTWMCPHPLETSPGGSICLRMSSSLPVYGQVLLPRRLLSQDVSLGIPVSYQENSQRAGFCSN